MNRTNSVRLEEGRIAILFYGIQKAKRYYNAIFISHTSTGRVRQLPWRGNNVPCLNTNSGYSQV